VRADLRNRVERFEVSELSDVSIPQSWRCRVSLEADGVTRIALAGELDMSVAPAFRAELERALTEHAKVIVDLRALDFMDSSGIHALAAADTRARASGARLLIEHPAAAVLRMLELTGMLEVLEIVDGSGSATR
jgi:anti-sigma B factor antagonist